MVETASMQDHFLLVFTAIQSHQHLFQHMLLELS